MNKEKYYVSIKSSEISQIPFGNNTDFIIHATKDEVTMLRSKMNNMYDADFRSFWRAHVPFVPYHKDTDNDEYDANTTAAMQMIYDLGDNDTKSHITSMGILGDRHM